MNLIKNINKLLILTLFTMSMFSCSQSTKSTTDTAILSQQAEKISMDLPWSQRMAESIMKRNPESWMTDFRKEKGPKWSYVHGLVLGAIMQAGEVKKDPRYFEYAKAYADKLTNEDGEIKGYKITDFNIDNINPGKMFFDIYEKTGDKRYENVLHTLRKQLKWQPRTSEGGYWHKLRYPYQMWLDGVYMGEPFYARYAKEYNKPEIYDDIANQFILIRSKTIDSKTGLLYHGWDESRLQEWSDKETGLSQEIWGRAVGWYMMALVDVLDYFPEDHEKHDDIVNILKELSASIIKVQDEKTGLWYQVLDKPGVGKNYLEATVSSMFSYSLMKAVNNGYIDNKYEAYAQEAYDGIIENLIKVEDNGEIHLSKCCAVAGLGGKPYRMGDFDYYMNEPIIDNDTKGTGPFILASLEFEKRNKK